MRAMGGNACCAGTIRPLSLRYRHLPRKLERESLASVNESKMKLK